MTAVMVAAKGKDGPEHRHRYGQQPASRLAGGPLAIIVAVAIAGLITLDGESNWFEGARLLIAYGIIAAAFFLYCRSRAGR